jgi:hypothetical protein
VLVSLSWGSFVIVEYDSATFGDLSPYSQAAPGPRGWYVEVVSQGYLGSCSPAVSDDWLALAGFNPPDDETGNWWLDSVPPDEASQVLLDGLRCGRGCVDPALVVARTGSFPPRPDGGEPVPVMADDLAKSA